MEMSIKEIQQLENELFKEVVRVCDEYDVHYYAAYGTVLGAIRHKGIIPWDDDIDIYIPENELHIFMNAMHKGLDSSKYRIDFRNKNTKHRDFPRIGYTEYGTEIIHIDVFRLAGAPSNRKKQNKLRWLTGNLHLINNVKEKGVKYYILNKNKVFKAIVTTVLTAIFPLKLSVRLNDYLNKKYPYDDAEYVGSSVSKTCNSIVPKAYFGNGVLVQYEDFMIRVPEKYEDYLIHMYGDYMKYPSKEQREKAMNRIYSAIKNEKTGILNIYYDREKE